MMRRLMTGFVLCASVMIMGCKPAASDWYKATAANSLGAYQTFLRNYPKDKHADEARGRILALQDDQDWAKAQATNTIEGYQAYLQNEPGGIYARDAQYQLTALERADAWKVAQNEGSAASLKAFLKKYPQGSESNEARQKLSTLAYRIKFADTRSKPAAERERAQLEARFGGIIHEVVVMPPSADDANYTVMTSEPMSQADANSVCAALGRSHQSCKAVKTRETS